MSPETASLICATLEHLTLSDSTVHKRLAAIAELAWKTLNTKATAIVMRDTTTHGDALVHCAGNNARELADHMRKRCKDRAKKSCFVDLLDGAAAFARGNLKSEGWALLAPEIASEHGLDSVCVQPINIDGQIGGLLCHFCEGPEGAFDPTQETANFLAARVQAFLGFDRKLNHARRYEDLHAVTTTLLSDRDIDALLRRTLHEGLRLIGATRGWISRPDFRTRELQIVEVIGKPDEQKTLPSGRGITWKALTDESPVLADDVTAPQWEGIYEPFWKDTRSELAVPLVIKTANVLRRTETATGSKPMYVLNAESPDPGAFSRLDMELLNTLARHAAVLADGVELDRRLAELGEAQKEMSVTRGIDEILDLMGTTINKVVGFDYVNISLVTRDMKRIKTEYVLGVPVERISEFKRLANHPVSGNDIQAALTRTPRIEVPDEDDPRFDWGIFRAFDHQKLIRVFVPIVASNKIVLGTVEAGYSRALRKHIYEQDVRLLEGFVGYAVRALEQRNQSKIEKIGHELNAPLAGIRSNAEFLRRRLQMIDPDTARRKLADIEVDAEIMQVAVVDLEYLLSGRAGASLRIETGASRLAPTLVFRDIILKIVEQLAPLVKSAGLDPAAIISTNVRRIPPLFVDRARLNQVFYNLFLNAVKYAERDPAEFRIEIEAQAGESYVVSFSDWGIGIRPELKHRVFDEGFRTPEAQAINASGSGLGLTISRHLMREIGGDLKIVRASKPTTFEILLPKRLTNMPEGAKDTLGAGRLQMRGPGEVA